jgi:hypothetical protein
MATVERPSFFPSSFLQESFPETDRLVQNFEIIAFRGEQGTEKLSKYIFNIKNYDIKMPLAITITLLCLSAFFFIASMYQASTASLALAIVFCIKYIRRKNSMRSDEEEAKKEGRNLSKLLNDLIIVPLNEIRGDYATIKGLPLKTDKESEDALRACTTAGWILECKGIFKRVCNCATQILSMKTSPDFVRFLPLYEGASAKVAASVQAREGTLRGITEPARVNAENEASQQQAVAKAASRAKESAAKEKEGAAEADRDSSKTNWDRLKEVCVAILKIQAERAAAEKEAKKITAAAATG